MISFIFSSIAFIITISILISVHEFGHFWVARKCGVRVVCFSIGFGKPIFSWRDRQGTEFNFAIFPFGGYVKLAEEVDGEAHIHRNFKTMSEVSILRRILIAAAGPAVNLIFAVFALSLMYMIGINTLVPIIGTVIPNSIASKAGFTEDDEIKTINGHRMESWQNVQLFLLNSQGKDKKLEIALENVQNHRKSIKFLNLRDWDVNSKDTDLIESLGLKPYKLMPVVISEVIADERADMAGLEVGDIVIRVDGKKVNERQDFINYIKLHPEEDILIEIIRNHQQIELTIRPHQVILNDDNQAYGNIGVLVNSEVIASQLFHTQRLNPFAALALSVKETTLLTKTTFIVIGRIITGHLPLRTISGPIGIAQDAGQSAKMGIAYFCDYLALLSISLAVINLLPIPMLDGGLIFYYLLEGLRGGAPLSPKVRELGYKAGLLLILTITLIAVYNDISKLMN